MTGFLLALLLLSQPDPGDAFRWPNREWFRWAALSFAEPRVAAYPFLDCAVFVKENAPVTLSTAGALGAYVDAWVFSEDYGVFFTAKIWVPLPHDREWRSDSPTSF